jgi:hypothetical protein
VHHRAFFLRHCSKIFDKVRASSRLENGARRPEQSPIES